MDRQVFISYASDDKSVADRVCVALESSGITCWIAPRNIDAGADFPSAILQAVASAHLMVVVLSASAVASPHVLSEIDHAFSQRRPILPLRLSSVVLPKDFDYFLATQQWLEAPDGCTEEVLKRLVAAASDVLPGSPMSEAAAKPRGLRASMDARPRRRLIWSGGIVAALAAVSGVIAYSRLTHTANPHTLGTSLVVTNAPAGSNITGSTDKTSPSATKTWVNPKDGQTYVWIPPCSFRMGCSAGDDQCGDDEKPAHRVEIPKGFWLAQTEVTNGAYRKAGGRNPSLGSGDARLPVRGLSWPEAKVYCSMVGGRLPTEAEWEYAARGGTSESYYGIPFKIAWYEADSGDDVHSVGMKEPNAFGLYDMLGNVSEWVLDRYYNRYDLEASAVGPQVEQPRPGNASAVARGGFWAAEGEGIRVSHRSEMSNDQPSETVGVRCASDHS